jgi:hypothetical protein
MKSMMEARENKFDVFFEGFFKAFDLTGSYTPVITIDDLQDGPQKDADAWRGDWMAVGNDLRYAIERYQREFKN